MWKFRDFPTFDFRDTSVIFSVMRVKSQIRARKGTYTLKLEGKKKFQEKKISAVCMSGLIVAQMGRGFGSAISVMYVTMPTPLAEVSI